MVSTPHIHAVYRLREYANCIHVACPWLLPLSGPSIKSVEVDAVVRSAIGKFSDQTGRLWNSLADYYVQLGNFGKVCRDQIEISVVMHCFAPPNFQARDVYEEALESISTVRDFSLVFEAYQKFLENLVTVYSEMEEENEEGEDTAGSTADLLVEVRKSRVRSRHPAFFPAGSG